MKQKTTLLGMLLLGISMFAQETNPVITSWLQNTTGITGRHYVTTNPILVVDATLANVQSVKFNETNVYISATGIPAYITGPFLDGNPSIATTQNKIFKFPLIPSPNTGIASATTGGNIGVFKNGVALFDYRDGVAYSATATNGICGGPGGPNGNPPCSGGMGAIQVWNRDAIPAEMNGFDCAKAHPANGNYHHHQNPSAFKLDINVLSQICTTYPSDGLYAIDPNQHSPLIGFAYDGFPIYGAYAYTNTNGTGAIARMKSSYQLKPYTNGLRINGPAINQVKGTQTFFKGYFKEDYEYFDHTSSLDATYLDVHNGRICNTPEYPVSLYPNGIYCYFATVDANYNSAYPYVVGPTFYGTVCSTNPPSDCNVVTTIPNGTTTYLANTTFNLNDTKIIIAPNPAQDFIAIQTQMAENNLKVELIDELGKVIKTSQILQGSTLSIIETDTVYNGLYFLKISDSKNVKTFKVIINK
jgi:hypothetical protein